MPSQMTDSGASLALACVAAFRCGCFRSTDVPLLSRWSAKAGFLEEWGLLNVLKRKWGISVWLTLAGPQLLSKKARGTHSRRSAAQVCVVLCYSLKVSLCRSLKRGTVEGFPCRYAE